MIHIHFTIYTHTHKVLSTLLVIRLQHKQIYNIKIHGKHYERPNGRKVLKNKQKKVVDMKISKNKNTVLLFHAIL